MCFLNKTTFYRQFGCEMVEISCPHCDVYFTHRYRPECLHKFHFGAVFEPQRDILIGRSFIISAFTGILVFFIVKVTKCHSPSTLVRYANQLCYNLKLLEALRPNGGNRSEVRGDNSSLYSAQKYKPGWGVYPEAAGRRSGVCLQRDDGELRACRGAGGGGRRGRVRVKRDQAAQQRHRGRCACFRTAPIMSGR